MNHIGVKTRSFSLIMLFLSASFVLGACANKANMIKTGAAQFEVESLAAIEKINEFQRKETEASPLPPEEASDFFLRAVKKSSGEIDFQKLEILIDPLSIGAPQSEVQWQSFLQKMRQQYTTFTATFSSLDTGSLFAAPNVSDTVPIIDKLIAQMAAFANSVKDHPAVFIRERSAIAAEIEHVRDKTPHDETTDLKLLELERRLREVVAAEEKITHDTIEQALKAATLGTELRKLLLDYKKLNFDDITEGLSMAFKLVAGIPGLDLSGLQAKTEDMINTINKDSELKNFFDTALAEINSAREN